VPPELIRQDLGERGEERERLFDVWFQLEKERSEKFEMKGLEVTPYVEGKEQTRFELSMSLGEAEKGIVGLLEYDDRLFTAETTAQMLEDYLHLLELMVADPERNLSTFSLIKEDENQQVRLDLVANLEID
jgi:non-ribosomal peptide synthetase component F